MKIYIAGPMTGIKHFNHPAFFEAESMLAECLPRFEIINPARNSIGSWDGMTECEIWDAFMRISLEQVESCDIVYTLHGWENSKGAQREVQLAIELGKKIINYFDL